MHPLIMRRLVADRIREFHAEAAIERLARQHTRPGKTPIRGIA